MSVQQHQLMADISDYQSTFNARSYARAGRRIVMLKAADAADDAGAGEYPARAIAAHQCGLRVVHYLIVRYNLTVNPTIDHYIQRIEPYWHKGDRMLIDLEAYGGPAHQAAGWLADAQGRLVHAHQAPRALGYTNEAYMAEAGRHLADKAPAWIIAAYDGLLLGPGTPKLPHGSKTILAGKQYTDGTFGAQPRTTPGIGPCDDTILTPAGEHLLLGSPAPKLKRPIRHAIPTRAHNTCCCT